MTISTKANLTLKPESDDSSLFDLRLIWVTFQQWWKWAVPIGIVLSSLAAFFVANAFVPEYKATHLLEANHDFVVFKGVMPVFKNLANTEKPLIFNSIVLDPVLSDPENRTAPSLSDPELAEANLRENLSIYSGGTESRLIVSYLDSDPVQAAKICNAVVESYLRQRDAFDNTRISNLERWLEPEIQRWEQEVEERQQVVQELSKQTLGYSPGQQSSQVVTKSNLELATHLRTRIAELNLLISVGEAKLAMKSDQASGQDTDQPEEELVVLEPSQMQIDALVRNAPDVLEARRQLTRYQVAILDIEDKGRVGVLRRDYNQFKIREREFKAILAQAEKTARVKAIDQLKKSFRKEMEIKRIRHPSAAEQVAIETEKDLLREKAMLNENKAKLVVVRKQYEQERLRLEQFGGATAELQFAREELTVASDVLHKLRDRVAAIRTERRQDGTVRSLAPAKAPAFPVESIPFKKIAIFGCGPFLLPFVICLLLEIKVKRVDDRQTCEDNGLKIIGEISQMPQPHESGQTARLYQESIAAFRAKLAHQLRTNQSQTVAFVSAMAGEGKSGLAAQVAISLACATNKRVLLIDADLRRAEQHRIFATSHQPGLGDVLVQRLPLTDAIQTSAYRQLDILTSGEVDVPVQQLVRSDNWPKLLETAKQQYDFVVIDTAPVLSASETLTIVTLVDASVLCVLKNVSRIENTLRAFESLKRIGATPVGTCFSGTSPRRYVAQYGDYYSEPAIQAA